VSETTTKSLTKTFAIVAEVLDSRLDENGEFIISDTVKIAHPDGTVETLPLYAGGDAA
jgi:hypothetical protein